MFSLLLICIVNLVRLRSKANSKMFTLQFVLFLSVPLIWHCNRFDLNIGITFFIFDGYFHYISEILIYFEYLFSLLLIYIANIIRLRSKAKCKMFILQYMLFLSVPLIRHCNRFDCKHWYNIFYL